ncbi:hypothetical protein [Rhodopirellula sallentina]|nr:hypothetical protein [Rhodopirellula sallentina]
MQSQTAIWFDEQSVGCCLATGFGVTAFDNLNDSLPLECTKVAIRCCVIGAPNYLLDRSGAQVERFPLGGDVARNDYPGHLATDGAKVQAICPGWHVYALENRLHNHEKTIASQLIKHLIKLQPTDFFVCAAVLRVCTPPRPEDPIPELSFGAFFALTNDRHA